MNALSLLLPMLIFASVPGAMAGSAGAAGVAGVAGATGVPRPVSDTELRLRRAVWRLPMPDAASERVAPRDPWLGQDKGQHLFMSFAVTTMVYGVARAAGVDRRAALPVAGGVSLAAGLGKEVDDRRRGRFFSVRDLAFDLLGIGLGLTLVSHTR